MMNKNMWFSGILGVVTGDALGCPVQFLSREEVRQNPVTGMRGYGTFNLPAGTWTDDSSLTLALLDSLTLNGAVDLKDIMHSFVLWLDEGAYTPFNQSFDIGRSTMKAIEHYKHEGDPRRCGTTSEFSCGNGSLMRILPACLYACAKGLADREAIDMIHAVGSLTHAHIRCNIACGLYYFMVKAILGGDGSLKERLQHGLDAGFEWYKNMLADQEYVGDYKRLRDLDAFAVLPEDRIRSSGYVVDTLEAALWSLMNTDSFESALLTAVNLGEDTDTVGAVAGGLAGLFYGSDAIPEDWLNALQRREWIEKMCDDAAEGM